MGIDDIVNKGKDLYEQNKDKLEELLKSDQVEDVSDKVLDGVAEAAKKVLPDEHNPTIDQVRNNVDDAIGK